MLIHNSVDDLYFTVLKRFTWSHRRYTIYIKYKIWLFFVKKTFIAKKMDSSDQIDIKFSHDSLKKIFLISMLCQSNDDTRSSDVFPTIIMLVFMDLTDYCFFFKRYYSFSSLYAHWISYKFDRSVLYLFLFFLFWKSVNHQNLKICLICICREPFETLNYSWFFLQRENSFCWISIFYVKKFLKRQHFSIFVFLM